MVCCSQKIRFKHYADNDRGKTFFYRLRERLTCDYPITIYERLSFPYFCIVILNDKHIPQKARGEFLENYVRHYISDEAFRLKNYSNGLTFYKDSFLGSLEYDKLLILTKEEIKNRNLCESLCPSQVFNILFNGYDPHTYGMAFE